MSIDAIAALAATDSLALAPLTPPAAAPAPPFAGVLDQVANLNTRMQADDAALQTLALGDSDQLHRVLMNMESTRLSFDLLLQVRNKVLDAYQELMRLQV